MEKNARRLGKDKLSLSDDLEVTSALTMVDYKPDDEARQAILAEVLGAQIEKILPWQEI